MKKAESVSTVLSLHYHQFKNCSAVSWNTAFPLILCNKNGELKVVLSFYSKFIADKKRAKKSYMFY